MTQPPERAGELICDLVVVGSGAGGLSTAITARKHGLDVVVIEKAPVFGGTTAFSGGVLWIPGNRHTGVADIDRELVQLALQREDTLLDELKQSAAPAR